MTFDSTNFWRFVAGVAVTIAVTALYVHLREHEHEHDDGDDESDDRDGVGVHERVDTQVYDFPIGQQPRPLMSARGFAGPPRYPILWDAEGFMRIWDRE